MIHDSLIFSVITCVLTAALYGCSSSSSDAPSQVLALGDAYDEKAGDVFTTSLTMSIIYSNGQTENVSSESVSTYSQVDEIPAKYNYSNTIGGPYLLETTNEDGVLDELEYKTLSGSFIIDDNLKYYTSVDFTTQSGSEDPENIYIGDRFSFFQNSTLFDSQTGLDAGYEITNIDFSVLSMEDVTVPAGTFQAVKILYSITETESKNNVVDTSSGNGHVWLDSETGFMLKMNLSGNSTLNSLGLTATFTAETILQNYFISPNGVSALATGVVPTSVFLNSGLQLNDVISALSDGIPRIQ